MNDFHNGIFYSLTKEAVGVGTVIGATAGTALAGLAIHDAVRTAQYSHKDIADFMTKNPVDAKRHIRKVDKKINVVTDEKALNKFVDKELADEPAIVREVTRNVMNAALENQNNAFAYSGDEKDYIVTGKKVNPVVLDHEIGHILDFREKNREGSLEDSYGRQDKGFLRSLASGFVKSIHDSDVIAKEKAAWGHVSPSSEKEEIETAALNSYNRGFYLNRGRLLGPIGGAILGTLIGKHTSLGPGLGFTFGSVSGALPSMVSSTFTEGVK